MTAKTKTNTHKNKKKRTKKIKQKAKQTFKTKCLTFKELTKERELTGPHSPL